MKFVSKLGVYDMKFFIQFFVSYLSICVILNSLCNRLVVWGSRVHLMMNDF